ncbi:MAG: DEAD/DEAH box helicase [Euryarchaeota archaeon]|nr:DEAD/DEAH box helicase [Euryarchaeota archaeon]
MEISNLGRLTSGGLSKEHILILNDAGIEELYPPQEEALRQGLLSLKSSFVVSVPTASGKTLIAELLMVKSILESRGASFPHREKGNKCLYIVPLRALASEKIEEFKKYEKLGIRTAISTGDYDTSDSWLANYDIIVTTSEKADSLLRHRSSWLADVSVLVVDEIHLIHDSSRGPTLEVTIAKLRQLNPKMLVLGLSATIKNADEIASWLNAKLISMDWRPVPLREGVFLQGEIFFNDSRLSAVEKISSDNIQSIALEIIKEKGQSLVFVNNRKSAEKFALDIAEKTKKFVSLAEEKSLKVLAKQVLGVLSEPTKICRRLAKCMEGGAAFHHAGLAAKQRRAVEEAFRKNLIKVLSATPTLAAGVNLPARRVIIRDYTRYDINIGRVEIPVLEYKQQAGRAGRPKYDKYGEAILIARSEEEKAHLLDNYILSEPEEISSKLGVEGALRTHVLATIAMGYANSLSSLMEFFSKTFFAHQQEPYLLEGHIHKVVNFLLREKMCIAKQAIPERNKEKNGLIVPTLFGKRVSELYIDPLSAVILRDALFRAQKVKTNALSYLQVISHTPELGSLYLRAKDYDMCVKEAVENEDCLLAEMPDRFSEPWKFEEFLSEMKTALFIKDWADERSEDFILEKYGLGPGDVRSKVERADWLLYSMFELGKVFRVEKLGEISRLRERVKHGIKEELLELITLSGIGRVRARRLYAHGLKTLKDLKKADIATISNVELIGKKIALNIKKQLGEKVEDSKEIKQNQRQISEF